MRSAVRNPLSQGIEASHACTRDATWERGRIAFRSPLQGLLLRGMFSQGVALGWGWAAPLGLRRGRSVPLAQDDGESWGRKAPPPSVRRLPV